MKSIRLGSLRQQPRIDRIDILSLTPALYTMRAHIGHTEYRILDHGASVRRASAEALKQLLVGCNVGEYRLVHQSAYDEMVGQPGGGDNKLDVPTSGPDVKSDYSDKKLH